MRVAHSSLLPLGMHPVGPWYVWLLLLAAVVTSHNMSRLHHRLGNHRRERGWDIVMFSTIGASAVLVWSYLPIVWVPVLALCVVLTVYGNCQRPPRQRPPRHQ